MSAPLRQGSSLPLHMGPQDNEEIATNDSTGPPQTPPHSRCTSTVDEDRLLKLNGKAWAAGPGFSTPFAEREAGTSLDPKAEEQKRKLETELQQPIEDSRFVALLYLHLASDGEIDEFLKTTIVYNMETRRWELPRSETHANLKESDMYKPLVTIINAIITFFYGDTKKRMAVDTHSKQLSHKEAVPSVRFSLPDISVRAKGPSFQLPDRKSNGRVPTTGYSNISTCFEIKIENQEWTFGQQLLQLALYARQIFIQQPNRRFVRVLLITEQNFRLFHFDRSGVQHTEPMNIHEKTHIFVRLVLGLTSLKEHEIGLDDSIQWKVVRGRKVSGTLTALQTNNTAVTYNLVGIEPTVRCLSIRDRGITCWSAVDPHTGKPVLVKDCWRAEDRVSEDIHLQKVVGLPGIVQMISCERNRGETKRFRGFDESCHSDFLNRIAIRIVMDSDGRSIEHFQSPKELLCALRDAIAGHRRLYLNDILHREVSIDNILLGKPGAGEGYRGMLMGLDLAKEKKTTSASAELITVSS
ncbi:hypothetical protein H1R20_g10631, partial [Candolleomyces eurysporus]